MTIPFSKLTEIYEQLEVITSGNKMREILSNFFKKVPKQDIDKVAYLTLGKIDADFKHIELGLAEKMILRAIASVAEKDIDEIKSVFKKIGDIGSTAEKTVKTKGKRLTVEQVFNDLHKIAEESGTGSQERKISILANLLVHATPKEAKYVARIALGTLRLGTGAMTVLDSLAITFTGTKANKPKLEHAYNICSDVGLVAKTIAIKGLKGIEKIPVNVGVPIRMMLCQRIKSLKELKEKILGKLSIEEKYDGERIQVHKTKDKIVLFSRRLEDISDQFPDIINQINKNIKAKEFVIEGEAVAIDEKGNLLPFQVLMQRRRKYDIEKYVKKIPVCLFLFDLLYLNGKTYLHEPYLVRHKALEKILKKQTKYLQLGKTILSDKLDKIEDFFNKTVEHGGEGIIAKSTAKDSVYKAGTRGWIWIKWKREYAKELADTFDLVVVGAFKGRGRRAGTYGALLCAAYNKKVDQFETVCKLGSGFTDKQLAELPKKFKKHEISHKPARLEVHKDIKPDIWFNPEVVVEVLGSELTRSPIHTCSVEKGKGLALRFPRFVHYRSEKSPEQATTSKEILQMYSKKK